MWWIHLWRFAGALDALALGAWTVLGRTAAEGGLRGSSYEQGRPTSEDVLSLNAILALLATMVVAHVGVAAWGLAKGRRDAWVGSLVAVAAMPITMSLGVIAVGGMLRLIYG